MTFPKDIDYVAVDCFGSMEQVTVLLLEAGYRNLLFLGLSMKSGNVIDCYFGYCKAMEKRGLEAKAEKLVQHFQMEDNRITADVSVAGFGRYYAAPQSELAADHL